MASPPAPHLGLEPEARLRCFPSRVSHSHPLCEETRDFSHSGCSGVQVVL